MKPVPLKVARIGNSRGVRLPAATLERYRISDFVVMEERSDGILLRPQHSAGQKLSWEETANAMGSSREDWTEWDGVAADGLNDIPWEPGPQRGVTERPAPPYGTKGTPSRKKRS
jgi:antitoxin component of MazEF toxin-antitoxin module